MLAIIFLLIFVSPVAYFYNDLAKSKNRNRVLWTIVSSLLFIFIFVALAWGIDLFFNISSLSALLISLFFTYVSCTTLYFFLKKNWTILEKETNENILDDLD